MRETRDRDKALNEARRTLAERKGGPPHPSIKQLFKRGGVTLMGRQVVRYQNEQCHLFFYLIGGATPFRTWTSPSTPTSWGHPAPSARQSWKYFLVNESHFLFPSFYLHESGSTKNKCECQSLTWVKSANKKFWSLKFNMFWLWEVIKKCTNINSQLKATLVFNAEFNYRT